MESKDDEFINIEIKVKDSRGRPRAIKPEVVDQEDEAQDVKSKDRTKRSLMRFSKYIIQ